jgi:hypothetical protein
MNVRKQKTYGRFLGMIFEKSFDRRFPLNSNDLQLKNMKTTRKSIFICRKGTQKNAKRAAQQCHWNKDIFLGLLQSPAPMRNLNGIR